MRPPKRFASPCSVPGGASPPGRGPKGARTAMVRASSGVCSESPRTPRRPPSPLGGPLRPWAGALATGRARPRKEGAPHAQRFTSTTPPALARGRGACRLGRPPGSHGTGRRPGQHTEPAGTGPAGNRTGGPGQGGFPAARTSDYHPLPLQAALLAQHRGRSLSRSRGRPDRRRKPPRRRGRAGKGAPRTRR